MPTLSRFTPAFALLLALVPARAAAQNRDSAFSALQQRGAQAMGVDQYTSAHVFERLSDGGRIVLRRDTTDSAGVETIRAHMHDIAERFGRGDFTIPGVVHARTVPGTDVMSRRRDRIRYAAESLAGGAQVRITTTDPEALRAVHAFLAFQAMDHRAADHEHGGAGRPD